MSTDQVRDVMNKYVLDDRFTIVVVAPAAQVKEQLEKLVASPEDLEIRPMPMKRPEMQPKTAPQSDEMLKKAN